jgi:hypothetical protein
MQPAYRNRVIVGTLLCGTIAGACSRSRPSQPLSLPGPPPPVDRPETITLLVFDDGVFTGTNLLIRSDLYNGQECRDSGAPYRFIARIGYYECLHQSQAD